MTVELTRRDILKAHAAAASPRRLQGLRCLLPPSPFPAA